MSQEPVVTISTEETAVPEGAQIINVPEELAARVKAGDATALEELKQLVPESVDLGLVTDEQRRYAMKHDANLPAPVKKALKEYFYGSSVKKEARERLANRTLYQNVAFQSQKDKRYQILAPLRGSAKKQSRPEGMSGRQYKRLKKKAFRAMRELAKKEQEKIALLPGEFRDIT